MKIVRVSEAARPAFKETYTLDDGSDVRINLWDGADSFTVTVYAGGPRKSRRDPNQRLQIFKGKGLSQSFVIEAAVSLMTVTIATKLYALRNSQPLLADMFRADLRKWFSGLT